MVRVMKAFFKGYFVLGLFAAVSASAGDYPRQFEKSYEAGYLTLMSRVVDYSNFQNKRIDQLRAIGSRNDSGWGTLEARSAYHDRLDQSVSMMFSASRKVVSTRDAMKRQTFLSCTGEGRRYSIFFEVPYESFSAIDGSGSSFFQQDALDQLFATTRSESTRSQELRSAFMAGDYSTLSEAQAAIDTLELQPQVLMCGTKIETKTDRFQVFCARYRVTCFRY
jgi:hypothetical protein